MQLLGNPPTATADNQTYNYLREVIKFCFFICSFWSFKISKTSPGRKQKLTSIPFIMTLFQTLKKKIHNSVMFTIVNVSCKTNISD